MENNIKALELMILSTTLLGNDSSEAWQNDAKKILAFLSKAFGLDDEKATKTTTNILKVAQSIVTSEDATISLIEPVGALSVNEIEYLKGKILLYLQSFFDNDPLHFTDYRYVNPYLPSLHFHNMNMVARDGYLIALRHVALLYHLGIGVSKDTNRAINLLWNCAYWADETSLYILKEIAREEEEFEREQDLRNLIALLEKGLYDGTTEISDESRYNIVVIETYKLISSLFHDIILTAHTTHFSRQRINSSFIEVMRLKHLSYETKMQFINEYDKGAWKNESNKISPSSESIGFLGGKR